MKQSATDEAYAESLDLARFVRGLLRLPTVSKVQIDKRLTDQKARAAAKATVQRNK